MGIQVQDPNLNAKFDRKDVSTWIIPETMLDGKLRVKALSLPNDITETEKIILMSKLQGVIYEGKTYFTPPEKGSITKQYQISLMTAIHKLMVAMEDPNTPEDVRNAAANQMGKYWDTYAKAFSHLPLPVRNPEWVKAFLDDLIKKEEVMENRVVYYNIEQNGVTIKTQEAIAKLDDTVTEKVDLHLQTTLFEQWNQETTQNIALLTPQDRERIAGIAKVNPSQVIAWGENDRFSPSSYRSFLDTTRLYSLLNIAGYKSQLRESTSESEKQRLQLQIAGQILKTIRTEYPWVMTQEAQDPGKMLETKQMLCVGKVSLMHGFLEELDIPHSTITMHKTDAQWNGHIAMTLQIDGKDYLADPTNLQELIPIASRKINPDTNKMELDFQWFSYLDSSQWSYDYEATIPESGIMQSILNNHAHYGNENAKMAEIELWSQNILEHTQYKGIGLSKEKNQAYRDAILVKPTGNFQETLLLGKLYWESGDTVKSIEEYQKCMKQYPTQTPLWCFESLIQSALETHNQNLLQESLSILISNFGEYNKPWEMLNNINPKISGKAWEYITYISAIRNIANNWEYKLSIWEKLSIRKKLFIGQYNQLAKDITEKIS